MCVSYHSRLSKKVFNSKVQPVNGFFIGYKTLYSGGVPACMGGEPYKTGVNYAKDLTKNKRIVKIPTPEQYRSNEGGVHVYLDKTTASYDETDSKKIIEVLCHVDDLIISDDEQAALTKVRILNSQWTDFQNRFVNRRV